MRLAGRRPRCEPSGNGVARSRTIIIAGAGIGGLTAALHLARAGYRVVVLEQAPRLEEAGAGIQLSPNATRVLDARTCRAAAAARGRAAGDPRHRGRARAATIVRIPLGEAADNAMARPIG